MAKTKFSFGKITATPTDSSWSQAYNAGALFVVLSLHANDEKGHEPLAGVGKNFLNDLEAEFFTLEEKNLSEISSALEKTVANIPDTIDLTTLLAFIKGQTLYLLLIGKGSIIIKRNGKIGTLLKGDTNSREIQSASGALKPHDSVFLATSAFRTLVSDSAIQDALSLSDTEAITEALTPHVHKTEEGNACAIIFKMEEEENAKEDAELPVSDEAQNQNDGLKEEENVPPAISSPAQYHAPDTETEIPSTREINDPQERGVISGKSLVTKLLSVLPLSLFHGLSHRKKVFLSIATIIIVILIVSIFFTISNQYAQERKTLFNEIYPEAFKNVEEAEGIISLNKIQARAELEEAQTLLAKTEGKFPKGTEEYEKTEELVQKIDSLLSQLGDSVEVEAEKIANADHLLLSSLIPSERIAVVEDETSVYYLTEDEIGSIRKASKSEQELVTNDGDWDRPIGFGKFASNFYILDTTHGILKLVPSGSDYAVSDYLTEDIDLSDSTSMTIDGSIYVLFDNGSIKKFTRGVEDDFELEELETPLLSPSQIFTNEEIDNIYVLDPKASRIVKFTKSGAFIEEYLSSTLLDAKGFSISPDEKTAFVLSKGILYSLSL